MTDKKIQLEIMSSSKIHFLYSILQEVILGNYYYAMFYDLHINAVSKYEGLIFKALFSDEDFSKHMADLESMTLNDYLTASPDARSKKFNIKLESLLLRIAETFSFSAGLTEKEWETLENNIIINTIRMSSDIVRSESDKEMIIRQYKEKFKNYPMVITYYLLLMMPYIRKGDGVNPSPR